MMEHRAILKWVFPLLYTASVPVLFVVSVAWFSFLEFRLFGRFEVLGAVLGSIAAWYS